MEIPINHTIVFGDYSGVYGQPLKALHMRVTGVTIWDVVITYPCQASSLQHTPVLITLDDLLTLLASSLPATSPRHLNITLTGFARHRVASSDYKYRADWVRGISKGI